MPTLENTMKRSLFCMLFLLIQTTAQAEETQSASPMAMLAGSQQASSNTASPATVQPATPNAPAVAENNSPATSPTSEQSAESTPTSAIDCDYTISGAITDVSNDTIVQWANYAATQTFTYDFQNYDKQFQKLKQCYTTAGWESFEVAMKASNNLKVTQEEHLFVSAQINGTSQLVSQSHDETQPAWIVRIPLKVVYQNQDKEVSQDMYVDLTIKTIYGSPLRLGINQIIASPKSAETPAQPSHVEATK